MKPLHATLLSCVAVAALVATACEPIRLATEHSEETVISRRLATVPGGGVQVSSRLEGTHFLLRAARGCDRVVQQRVRVQEQRVADEDLTEELVLLGVATVPLAAGIALLADAPSVYPADRNGRLYNPAGETAPVVAGVILTSLGGLVALAPIVQLVRIAAAGEHRESVIDRRGATERANVRCPGEPQPRTVQVSLRAGGRVFARLRSGPDGRLDIDLPEVVPAALAARYDRLTVLVGAEPLVEVDLEPVRAAQRERLDAREEGVWRSIDVEGCRRAGDRGAQVCRPLEAYLEAYPEGAHADEVRELLGRRREAVIATDEPADAALGAAVQQAIEASRRGCTSTCERVCAGKRDCVRACAVRACGSAPERAPGSQGDIP